MLTARTSLHILTGVPLARVAAVVTSFTTRQVVECWTNPSLDADQVIARILSALHHPFNINFAGPDHLQSQMFQAATEWWFEKTDQQRDFLRHRLVKSTIAAGQHKHLISDPAQWHNVPTFGSKPAENKSVVDTLFNNIKDAVEKKTIDIAQATLNDIGTVLRSDPTPQTPNTVDLAISMIPGAMPVRDLLKGIPTEALISAPTAGNILKTVFSFW